MDMKIFLFLSKTWKMTVKMSLAWKKSVCNNSLTQTTTHGGVFLHHKYCYIILLLSIYCTRKTSNYNICLFGIACGPTANAELRAYYTLSGEEDRGTKIFNPVPDKGVFCMTCRGCGTILSTYYYIALKFSRAVFKPIILYKNKNK